MATDWNKLKVVDLKAELKRLGLPQNGLKADLVARLEAADTENNTSQPSDEAVEEAQDVNGDAQPQQEVPEAPETAEPIPSDEAPAEVEKEVETKAEAEAEAVVAAAAEEEELTPIVTETQATQPSSSGATPLQPTEVIQDSQKRKRRSLSPAPSAHEVARKRARQDDPDTQNDQAANSPTEKVDEVIRREEDMEGLDQVPADVEMQGTKDEAPLEHERERDNGDGVTRSSLVDTTHLDDQNGHTTEVAMNDTRPAHEEPPEDEPARDHPHITHPAEIERDVEPSIHPATSALYIKNFMRPLRPQAVKEHLLDLATSAGAPMEDDTIVDFYLDTIRTHAFVVFSSISSASRVRTALHNRVWPDETNRKALWVDFMPPERYEEWVAMEQASTGGRGSTNRYEVVYDNDDDGNVVVRLEEFDGLAPPPKQAPLAAESQPERKQSIPTGPSRPFSGIENAPTGPRGFQPSRGPVMHSRSGRVEQGISTRTYPNILYQPVSDELVKRRLDAIAVAKTKDSHKDFGKEYKRYFFESGDVLVDRGPEIFLGIRPPHRERERQRERGRDRDHEPRREPGRNRRGPGGGGGGRPRRGGMPIFHGIPRGGDRFRPSDSGSGANGRSRYADDKDGHRDNYSRHRDNRGSRKESYNRY
ncbi:hypothetical protein F5Y04DRAFT_240988 [Hypomontagnella monticulosa]|nr:hypothetical protein F5Y04DRAFT_240988 [Hypomontagnella monticulosa]